MDLEKLVDFEHMVKDVEKGSEIYMLCPVRKATDYEIDFLESYKDRITKLGYTAHYPAQDTNQDPHDMGYTICEDHCDEINRMDEVHVYWNGGSTGSYVDLGQALYLNWKEGKKIKLMNRKDVSEMDLDKYTDALLKLDEGKEIRGIFDSEYHKANQDEISINWEPSPENYTKLGFYMHLFFNERKKIRLENPGEVEKIVEQQRKDGIPKSYDMVLLKLDKISKAA